MPNTHLVLPGPDGDWVAFVDERITTGLTTAAAAVATLKDGTARSAMEALTVWDRGDQALGDAAALASLFAEVHPQVEVRTRCEGGAQEIAAFATKRAVDGELFAVLSALDPADLDDETGRLLRLTLRDFRRAGVDRDEQTRARLIEISDRQTLLGQEFSRNIRDDVPTVRLRPEQLAGLPQDFIDAHPVDDDGLVTLTTDYPDSIPFRTFAHDAAARTELVTAFLDRAYPQNDPILHELLDLRAEQAALLDHPDWPSFDAEVKMIKEGPAIADFIDRISALAETPGRRDLALLEERARRDDPDRGPLTSADSAYYSELVRREQFDVDAQEVRTYSDFAKVRAGLLEVTGALFGLTYVQRTDAPVWDPAVTAYDVIREGANIGRIYLDLHPRDGKFKHAAQFTLVSGVDGRALPEGTLVCNFATGLMPHLDVVTLFHEFGHLLHHILAGQQHWVRFSGVATEWDFVEAPSQMLEEWAWDPGILASFATNADGEPIPADLVAKMVAAKEFGKGLQARTQMFYAATSYYLHKDRPADHAAYVAELQRRYDLFAQLPSTHFSASFGHLEGYTSAYYTYMWSLVIAKDMFSAFDRDDMLAPAVAARYRDLVLARGGSKDAADLVADFLGRPYSFDTFGAWLAS